MADKNWHLILEVFLELLDNVEHKLVAFAKLLLKDFYCNLH